MGKGWLEIKKIKNSFYLYYRWREGGRIRSRYLGRWYGSVSSSVSSVKAKDGKVEGQLLRMQRVEGNGEESFLKK